MGFLGFDSNSSEATDNRIAVADQGLAIRGNNTDVASGEGKNLRGNNSLYAESGAIAVGTGSKYQESGSYDLSRTGVKGNLIINDQATAQQALTDMALLTSQQAETSNLNTVIMGDVFSKGVSALASLFTDASRTVNANNETTADALRSAQAYNNDVLQSALTQTSSLAQTSQTSGGSNLLDTIKPLALGVLALGALFIIFRRK
jgi:hypothetical protein